MRVVSEIEVERIISRVQNELRNDPNYDNSGRVSDVTTADIAEFAIERLEEVRRSVKSKSFSN